MSVINKITVAYGDGIGPEIMEAVLNIFKEADVNLGIDVIEIGEHQYEMGFKSGIPDSAWDTILNNKILLKAPITTPQGKGYKSLNVTLRKALGLYANIRPVKSLHPFIKTNFPNQDLVVVRENEEDLYAGIEYRSTRQLHQSLKVITRTGCEKIIKYAFDYAIANGRKKVTCVIKDNIMKMTDGLFHKVFDEIAAHYPEIEAKQMIVDIATAKVGANPEIFDVIVTENLYGDIISDVAAEVAGSVGVGGSANIGKDFAMFEAVHGSAPDIAGKNIANPTGLINAAIMMLSHIGMCDKANLIVNALYKTLEDGIHTGDLYRKDLSKEKVGTKEFAEAVIARLGQKPKKLTPPKAGQDNSCATTRSIKLKKEVVEKYLVGTDIFIDCEEIKENGVEQIAERINKITKKCLLQLQMISNKGLKIWPDAGSARKIEDYARLRFVSKDAEKVISHNEIVKLLECFAKAELDFIKIENLYVYGDEVGFSVPQGE